MSIEGNSETALARNCDSQIKDPVGSELRPEPSHTKTAYAFVTPTYLYFMLQMAL